MALTSFFVDESKMDSMGFFLTESELDPTDSFVGESKLPLMSTYHRVGFLQVLSLLTYSWLPS